MKRISYWETPGLGDLYFEDSFLLSVSEDNDIVFTIEAVLREDNPKYVSPKPDEQYCYRLIRLIFPRVRDHEWKSRRLIPIIDKDGSFDYGNIAEFFFEDGLYHVNGEWGELVIASDPPIVEYV